MNDASTDNLRISGLHHVTAIAGDAQDNLDFYTGLLGLRLVKKTVNFEAPERTARLLTDVFGYEEAGEEGERLRFRAPGASRRASVIDLRTQPSRQRGRSGSGTVHHIAFRASDEEEQQAWRRKLLEAGLNVTPTKDRQYFKSIYFREPGGVLFEIATDPPGFHVDESDDTLGTALKLPEWLEPRRERIEARLPELRPPEPARG